MPKAHALTLTSGMRYSDPSSWTESRGWVEHCRALVGVRKADTTNSVTIASRHTAMARLAAAKEHCTIPIDVAQFYAELTVGANYGSLFQLQDGCNFLANSNYAIGNVVVPDTAAGMPMSHETPSLLPATMMDLFSQLTFVILGAGRGIMESLYMPCAITSLEMTRSERRKPGDEILGVAHGALGSSTGPVDFALGDAWSSAQPLEPVLSLTGFRMTPVKGELAEAAVPRSLCFKTEWEKFAKVEVEGAETNGKSEKSWLDGAAVIITDRDQTDPLVAALVDTITTQTKQPVSVSSFDKLVPAADNYVYLAELESPILSTISPAVFNQLQNLLLTCNSLLWVSTGSYKTAKSPATNLAQGLMRTIRSESTKATATLELDPKSLLSAQDSAELIIQAFEASLNADNKDTNDYEFAEENGSLMVPRVLDDAETNEFVHRQTQSSQPYLQDFDQGDRRLQLAIGSYGALDTLYFRDEVETPLAADDIEVRVAAHRIQLQGCCHFHGPTG